MYLDVIRGTRFCVICHERLPETARMDTRTCSARCRQRLARLRRTAASHERIRLAQQAGTRAKRLRREGLAGPQVDALEAQAKLTAPEAVLRYRDILTGEIARLRRAGRAAAPADVLPDTFRATVWLALAPERYGAVIAAIQAMADAQASARLERDLLEGLSRCATHLRQLEAAVMSAKS